MSQLSWPHILPVVLRLKVSEALLRGEYAWDTYRNDKPSQDLVLEFKRIAAAQLKIYGRDYRSPADVLKEGPAIDAYLQRIGTEFKSAARLAAKSPEARRLFETLLGVCGTEICNPCSGANACAWVRKSGAADQKRVTSGDCLRSVQDLFAWTHSVVADSYERAGVARPTHPPKLVTGHDAPNTDLGMAINASTHDSLERGVREVRLTFDPESFWVSDYLSLAYIFAHECTAHVWCGVDIDSRVSTPSTPFHDGWMDEVAAAILYGALEDTTTMPPTYAEEIWDRTFDVRGIRLSSLHPKPPGDQDRWRKGVRAFKTLHFLFVQALSGELDQSDAQWRQASIMAQQHLIDVSLRINASRISHQDRARFLQTIVSKFDRICPKARQKALDRKRHVIDLIQNLVDRNDETNFVRQFVAL